jgi:hypothetical protein
MIRTVQVALYLIVVSGFRATSANNDIELPLLAFVTMGCSMSTVVTTMANKLLEAHGFKMMLHPNYGDSEVLNLNCIGTGQHMSVEIMKKKNMFYRPDEKGNSVNRIISAMRRYVAFKDIHHSNSVVKFDSVCLTGRDQQPLRDFLRSIPLRTVALYRRNVLDFATCYVRDFYGKCSHHEGQVKRISPGHDSVNATTGQPSDVCFKRRSYHGDEKYATKAKFNIDSLEALLNYFGASERNLKRIINSIRDHNPRNPPLSVASEDLMAYEYRKFDGKKRGHENTMGKGDIQDISASVNISVSTWNTVLRHFGLARPNETVIRNVLEYSKPGSKTLLPHKYSIFNVDEVEFELKRIGNITYFRSDGKKI